MECFEDGFLIFPRPSKSDLHSLCQHRRIELIPATVERAR
jgi:hypothetical protein